jgi:hypothetical protein
MKNDGDMAACGPDVWRILAGRDRQGDAEP